MFIQQRRAPPCYTTASARVHCSALHLNMSVLDDANMSLLSPTPDDDDTYSTKVYFGPLQSPEKKLASLFNPQANYSRDQGGTYTSSPSRRSPPLSASPQPRDSDGQIQTEQEELDTCDKDSVYPWQGTPLHNILRRDGKPCTTSVASSFA